MFLVLTPGARSQNLIVQDGWQGFATRNPDGAFDRCVLYNRTVAALNTAPYNMLGFTRDGKGNLGLMAFFEPSALTRGRHQPVSLTIDQHAPVTLEGDVPSDFHVVIAGPFAADTLSALRQASSIEVTVGTRTLRVAVSGVGAALDRLAECTATYAR